MAPDSLDERPTAFYIDGGYLAKHPSWDSEHGPWKAKQVLDILGLEFLRALGPKPITIADFGCGSGATLHALVKELRIAGVAVTAVGYDVSPAAIELGKELFRDLDLRVGAIDEVDGHFDVIMLLDVLEHLTDPLAFLRSVSLKGSYFVLHVPLEETVMVNLRRQKPFLRSEYGHLHFFTVDTALDLVRSEGLDILKHRFTFGSVELPRNSILEKIAFPARLLGKHLFPALAAKTFGRFSLMVLARQTGFPSKDQQNV